MSLTESKKSAPDKRIDYMIDIGVNPTSGVFADLDFGPIVESAQKGNVKGMVLITNDASDLDVNLSLAKQHIRCRVTAGVHPHNVRYLDNEKFLNFANKIKKILATKWGNSRIVAIGECGLDYDRMKASKSIQQKWFCCQLDLAIKVNKPVYLHCRGNGKKGGDILDAHRDFIEIMKSYNSSHDNYFVQDNMLVHCFTGGWTELKDYLDMNSYIGITGWIVDKRRNKRLVDALKTAINDAQYRKLLFSKIMIETDSPWLYPRGLNGKNFDTNYPANLMFIAKGLAAVLEIPVSDLITLTTQNAKKFFRV